MKFNLSNIPQQIHAMGVADYRAGKSVCPFGAKSNAAKLWRAGWEEAERWPLILMMEGA